jgi:DNA-binding transcriptional LysR family regulator
LLPALVQALSIHAPGVALSVHSFTDRDGAVDLLDAGRIDAAIGVPPTHSDPRIRTRTVLQDEFVTLLRHDHPCAGRAMTMRTYLALAHVLVSPEGDRHGLVDQALAQQGKQRRLGLTLPHMFAAPAVVACTDMTATLMKRVALSAPASRRLVHFPPPMDLPGVAFDLIWHRRNDANPAQVWLRELVESTAGAL